MVILLALRHMLLRAGRTAFLLVGYGLGVGVMIVLLAVGEALVTQARQERLVGGGDVTVLPEGIDLEVLKTGGLGGMFFSIHQSRFIYRQILASPRMASDIAVAAPQMDGKLLYLRLEAPSREVAVLASGEIPSLSAALGVAPELVRGSWADDSGDRLWRDPSPAELRHEMDRFHMPAGRARGDSTWAEWHYFNVLWPGGDKWMFISYIVAGDVDGGRWGGQLLLTLHETGKAARRFTANVESGAIRFSTTRADLTLGSASVAVMPDGRYHIYGSASEDGGRGGGGGRGAGGGERLAFDLNVAPAPGAYFPPADLSDDLLVSGYVVPALRAEATGEVCVASRCERLASAQAYHDHNWGVWGGVTWEWGASRAGEFTLLYGRVDPGDAGAADRPLFVYLVDSLGFRAVFRPRVIEYDDSRVAMVGGMRLLVPAAARMVDVRGADTLVIEIVVEDATVTDMRRPGTERGDGGQAAGNPKPYFVQMKGRATISGLVGGARVSGSGAGFFETYR